MLDELEAALKGEYPSGLYLFNSNASRDEISELVRRYNFCFLYLDGLLISSDSEFFDEFGALINYPTFGDAGYDRLNDVLRELERWGHPPCCSANANGLILFYDGIHKFARNDPSGFDAITEIMYMSQDGERQVGRDANGTPLMEPFPRFWLLRGGNVPGVPEMHKSSRRTSKP